MSAIGVVNLLSPLCTEAFSAIATRAFERGAALEEETWAEVLHRPPPWIAFGCGWHYVQARTLLEAEAELVAAPVLADARYEDRPSYFSELVVRVDAPYRGLEDLRDATCAFNEERSFSGCILPAASLVRRGWSRLPFARLVRVGSHRRALDWVAEGRADVAPIDSWVLDLHRRIDPRAAARLRVLERFGPAPPPPVFGCGLGSSREQLVDALAGLATSVSGRSLLAAVGVARFVPTSDRTYDSLREAILTARELPWTARDGRPPQESLDQGPASR